MDSSTMLSDVLFQKGIMVVWMEAYISFYQQTKSPLAPLITIALYKLLVVWY